MVCEATDSFVMPVDGLPEKVSLGVNGRWEIRIVCCFQYFSVFVVFLRGVSSWLLCDRP
jgi:hypothetical protein